MISPLVRCRDIRNKSTLRRSAASSLKESIFDLFTLPPSWAVSHFQSPTFCACTGEVADLRRRRVLGADEKKILGTDIPIQASDCARWRLTDATNAVVYRLKETQALEGRA